MQCPKCQSEKLSVIDSRGDTGSIRRRRECSRCSFRFTTYERIERALPIVVKKDRTREPFARRKIRDGVMRAFEKRPVSTEFVDQLVDKIETAVHNLCIKEIESRAIGTLVVDVLKDIDPIAYIRFASVYQEFSSIEQFMDILASLNNRESKPKELETSADSSAEVSYPLKKIENGS
jgi:transcriptional repressor NrdR